MKIGTIKVGVDNCYLIQDRNTILIDGGMSGEFSAFKSEIKKLGVNPENRN